MVVDGFSWAIDLGQKTYEKNRGLKRINWKVVLGKFWLLYSGFGAL